MVDWKLRSCPRCKGDMFIEEGLDGWYQQCLQCSYRQDLKKPYGRTLRLYEKNKYLTRA